MSSVKKMKDKIAFPYKLAMNLVRPGGAGLIFQLLKQNGQGNHKLKLSLGNVAGIHLKKAERGTRDVV